MTTPGNPESSPIFRLDLQPLQDGSGLDIVRLRRFLNALLHRYHLRAVRVEVLDQAQTESGSTFDEWAADFDKRLRAFEERQKRV
jgi:hypothetical protein